MKKATLIFLVIVLVVSIFVGIPALFLGVLGYGQYDTFLKELIAKNPTIDPSVIKTSFDQMLVILVVCGSKAIANIIVTSLTIGQSRKWKKNSKIKVWGILNIPLGSIVAGILILCTSEEVLLTQYERKL